MKINHLKLDCASLDEQRHFYTKKFKFKLVEDGDEEITVQMGASLLTFRENRLKKPYYHFAFNIPFGAVEKALEWVKKKVEVIRSEDREIQDFSAWDAKALYFRDPAGNIVEFIGRKGYPMENSGAFSTDEVGNISEIGVPVFEVSTAYKSIKKTTGIKKFDCTGNTFCAAGDDEGLLIIVDKAEKTWFPTDAPAKDYNLEVNFREGEKRFSLSYQAGEMSLQQMGGNNGRER